MRGPTHVSIGVLAYILVNPAANIPHLVVAAIGALAPDLDHPNSYLTRRIARLPIFRRVGLILAGAALAYSGLVGLVILPSILHLKGQLLLGLALVAAAFLPHRGASHSLLGLFAATLLVHFSFTLPLAVPFAVGYASHLVADSLTDSGVPWLFPVSRRYSAPFGITTGSITEWLIGACVSVLLVSQLINKFAL